MARVRRGPQNSTSIFSSSSGVPLYIGLGASIYEVPGDVFLDLRIPFGFMLNFRSAPLQFFFELAIAVVLVSPYEPGDRVHLQPALGFRLFF